MKRMTIIALIIVLSIVAIYIGSIFLHTFFYAHGYDKNSIAHRTIIGHRGGAGIGAENSLTCLKRGIATGADMIEIDLHQTVDGVVVVSHDPTVDRMTDGTGTIAQMTYREISRLHIVNKDGEPTSDHVATFEEVVELFAEERSKGSDVKLLVEIKYPYKNAYAGIEKRMLDIISAHEAENWIVVQSFADDVIEKVHELAPAIRVEKLLICKLPFLPLIVDGLRITRFSYEKYHYVASFNFYYRALNHQLIADIHKHGKEVKMWTTDGTDTPRMDVDGIITDRPDLWCKEKGKE